MKVKLTKEEFIKRSMDGEVFEFDGCRYFYDKKEDNPFRVGFVAINNNWRYFKGETEFTVIEPKSKTKIVKEWMYLLNESGMWYIANILITDEEAKKHFEMLKYKPTGREFEVPEE